MNYWLISSNDDIFLLDECLKDNKIVDWQTSFHPNIGDIVFIYRAKPHQRINYMMEVTGINIPYRDSINDEIYWGKKHSPKGTIDMSAPYQRLKLIRKVDTPLLHVSELRKHEFKGDLIGPRKPKGELLDYILSIFEDSPSNYDEYDKPDGYFEGALKKVYVNRYERDQEARNNCLKIHGCTCSACGMDFEKVYGNIGKGFIHVHHIVPISSIGNEYMIDPAKDLVPVCPNCHAMLHHGEGGKVLTIEELKKRLTQLCI